MIRQMAYELWLHSPFVNQLRIGRPMAYLLDYEAYNALRRDNSPSTLSCFDAFAKTLFGWPVYIGPHAPPDGVLFLPERTVRSMAHGYPPKIDTL